MRLPHEGLRFFVGRVRARIAFLEDNPRSTPLYEREVGAFSLRDERFVVEECVQEGSLREAITRLRGGEPERTHRTSWDVEDDTAAMPPVRGDGRMNLDARCERGDRDEQADTGG